MSKWVYDASQCCTGECSQRRDCPYDAAIRAQREDADDGYITHRYADAAWLALAFVLGGCAVLIGYLMPLMPWGTQ
jgi:hypothetical protein